MFSSKFDLLQPKMPSLPDRPDYEGLVRFLVAPFLDSPESLQIDCERLASRPKVWVRLAFEGSDKGRVYGRGGRNLQAIVTVLQALARMSGQSVYLDVYNSMDSEGDRPSLPSPDRRTSRPRYRRSRSTPRF